MEKSKRWHKKVGLELNLAPNTLTLALVDKNLYHQQSCLTRYVDIAILVAIVFLQCVLDALCFVIFDFLLSVVAKV